MIFWLFRKFPKGVDYSKDINSLKDADVAINKLIIDLTNKVNINTSEITQLKNTSANNEIVLNSLKTSTETNKNNITTLTDRVNTNTADIEKLKSEGVPVNNVEVLNITNQNLTDKFNMRNHDDYQDIKGYQIRIDNINVSKVLGIEINNSGNFIKPIFVCNKISLDDNWLCMYFYYLPTDNNERNTLYPVVGNIQNIKIYLLK